MPIASYHPSLDDLSDFLTTPGGASRASVAAHLERCARCRESLQELRMMSTAARAVPISGPSADLRARVLASREAGARTILPTNDARPRSMRRWFVPLLAAAAVVAVALGSFLARTAEVEAGAAAGTLVLTPETPRAGQVVAVSYRPHALLSAQPWVALRARLRTPADESYNAGMPTSTLAVLRKERDGTFTGQFAVPESVVFAAFAVEDGAAMVVDDNTGRAWEMLVAGPNGMPQLEALDQRANDLMGRNWEEGFATARRMVTMYPNSIEAWSWFKSFQIWNGTSGIDSVAALHRAKVAQFDTMLARQTSPSPDDMGRLGWYAARTDTMVSNRWRDRAVREAPTSSFPVQWRLMDALGAFSKDKDTVAVFKRFDGLYEGAPPDRASQVANYALSIAWDAKDTTLIQRWTERLTRNERDQNAMRRYNATRFATFPALRTEGMRRLRTELAALETLSPATRRLGETIAEQRTRHAGYRRTLLASLGRALVAAGEHRAGLDTLAIAAATGWDVAVFHAVRSASLAAKDTASAITMAARLAADPRTDSLAADSLGALGRTRLGLDGWNARVAAARDEFVQRMLANARVRSIGTIELRDLNGQPRDLRQLADGKVTVVAFWSRWCSPAVEDLPRIGAIAERLTRQGVRVVSIVEEVTPTDELRAFLRDKKVTMPTYLDAKGHASKAFNQWGTPHYYVLDADGRIRFDATIDANEVLARAEALRLAAQSRTAAR